MDTIPVAIIGAACRLPGGNDGLSALRNTLFRGVDCITDLPQERWSLERYHHPDKRVPGRMYTGKAGVIENMLDFDPGVFGISNAEIPYIDPQQRLALELAWETIEDAGIPASRMAESATAVFMGASSMDFAVRFARDLNVANPRSMQGNSLSIVANRVSYFLRLHGPSMTLDTACSSSLHALHLACRLLASDRGIGMAFAGGVNVLIAPDTFIGFSKAEMLSPDGRCKAFDASANGYVRSEGGGMLLLKRLDDALAAGDSIHAVVRASAVNSDGRTSGIAMPSREMQERLLREVYGENGVDPGCLVYLEAHGTGTAVGDPVEAEAIGAAVATRRKDPLPIGSIKTNLGHLEPASGIAGVLKGMLVLKHGEIPKNLHFNEPNPDIDFAGLNLSVVAENQRILEQSGLPPCVGVNSFGFGGSNAHVVLEAPPHRAAATKRARPPLARPPLVLSAASRESLRLLAASYADFLAGEDAPLAYDVAAGVALGREALAHRLAVFAGDNRRVAGLLQAASDGSLEERPEKALVAIGESVFHGVSGRGGAPRTAFVFSGNGSQWVGMGKELFASSPVFADAFAGVDALFRGLGGAGVMEELNRPPERSRMADTEIAQPMLFAMQVGLVELLRERGLVPDAAYGHSVGEAAAAWCAGVWSIEDAVAFIHYRGRRQAASRGRGGMTAANISVEDAAKIAELTRGKVEVAGYNSAESVTLTGDVAALARVEKELTGRGVFNTRLDLEYPFHSRMMDPFRKALLGDLRGVLPREGSIPFISTVTGAVEAGGRLDAGYMWENVRKPVLFRQATEAALDLGVRLFLEIGPHPVLRYYLNDAIGRRGVSAAALSSLARGGDSLIHVEEACLRAWSRGWPLRIDTLFPEPPVRVDLPHYAWNRTRVPYPHSEEILVDVDAAPEHPLLGWRVRDLPVWENLVDIDLFPQLGDHRVVETPMFPATAFIEMALAAARAHLPTVTEFELRNLSFEQGMALPGGVHRSTRVSVASDSGELTIASRALGSDEAWTTHMRCRVLHAAPVAPESPPWHENPDAFGKAISPALLYRLPPRHGFDFGPAFTSVDGVWRDGDRALLRLRDKTGESGKVWRGSILCPPLLDSALHAGYLFLDENPETRGQPFLPVGFDRVALFRDGVPAWSLFTVNRRGGRMADSDIMVYDKAGRPLAKLEKLRYRMTGGGFSGANIGPALIQRMRPLPLLAEGFALPENDALKPADVGPAEAAGDMERFNDLASTIALAEVFAAILPELSSEPVSVAEFAKRLGAGVDIHHFISYLLDVLARQGAAVHGPDGWSATGGGEAPDSSGAWTALLAEFSHRMDRLGMLLGVAGDGEGLRRALCGGDASGKGNPVRSYHEDAVKTSRSTAVLRNAIEKIAASRPANQILRLLEPDAGEGELLEAVRALIEKGDCAYTMTANDERSLESLRLLWGAFEPAKIGGLTRDLLSTETASGRNRVHAAIVAHFPGTFEEMVGILRYCRMRLFEEGVCLIAGRRPLMAFDIVWGARTGWWRGAAEAAPHTPLADRATWEAAAHAAGFGVIECLWEDAEEFVLAARRPEPDDGVPGEEISNARALESHVLAARKRTRLERGKKETPRADWVFLIDAEPAALAGGIEQFLRRELENAGHGVRTVPVHSGKGKAPAGAIRHDSPEAWKKFWESLPRGAPTRCVFMAGMNCGVDVTTECFETHILPQTVAVVTMARGWIDAGEPPVSLILLSGGGQDAPGCVPSPSQGALWGAGRVLFNETPRLQVRLVDAHPPAVSSPAEAAARVAPTLLRELSEGDADGEVVLTETGRFCPRVEPMEADSRSDDSPSCAVPVLRLEPSRSGKIERARWARTGMSRPAPGKVIVSPRAVGLNFRDIMCAMGVLPGEAFNYGAFGPTLGNEFSGVVEEVGDGVAAFAPGDRVIGMGPSSLSTKVTADSRFLLPLPNGMSFEAGATLPIALSTAWYALVEAGRMKKGERLLVHAATGGVGLAALQIAGHLGVETFATAGSESKRAFLRLLGVRHVFDSRGLDFPDRVREALGGGGVDAVLNSLAGDAMRQSLEILLPYGRFLELGKRDLFGDASVGLRALRRNISYHAIDLDAFACDRPDAIGGMLRDAWKLVERGIVRPLPRRLYASESAVGALRDMQRARHIGKLICAMPPSAPVPAGKTGQMPEISPRVSYIVTGGTSGFGLATAVWLADKGARHILLISRRGAVAESDTRLAGEMRAAGVDIRIVAADVSDRKALFAAMDEALSGMPEVRGIIHAAGVIEDAAVDVMTPDQIERVMRPKVVGGWNLHEYSVRRQMTLDIFVLYSSVAALVGNRGQANYAAANACLDTLAAFRAALGLPALSVAWGPILDTGMLSRNMAARKLLKQQMGLTLMHSSAALAILESILATPMSAAAVFSADGRRLLRLPAGRTGRFAHFAHLAADDAMDGDSLLQEVRGKPRDEAIGLLERMVLRQVSMTLRMASDSINASAPLDSLGVDSLMAVEIGLSLGAELGENAPHVVVTANKTIRGLAEDMHAGILSDAGDGNGANPHSDRKGKE